MTTTQTAMIQAAASIAAMMPAKPAKKLMGDRTEQLVFSVYEQAAKAAYVRAAQECFGTAYTAAGGGGLTVMIFLQSSKTNRPALQIWLICASPVMHGVAR